MTCVLYGIVLAGSGRAPFAVPLPGIGGAAVRVLVAGAPCGLGAVVSTIDAPEPRFTVEDALAYARVVEALHADRAVVPMRFGCLFGTEPEVLDLLRARGPEFAEVLGVLDGCVEMGVRLLAARPDTAAADVSQPVKSSCDYGARASGGHGPGIAYLTRRKAAYAEADRLQHDVAMAKERVRSAFAGQFVEFRAETTCWAARPLSSRVLLSAYFLVKRDALEPFRQAFRELSRVEPTPLLLSGPWPPYNFVLPEPGVHGCRPD